MADDRSSQNETSSAASTRFEATIHPGPSARALQDVANLDLDRIPDPEGAMRVLVDRDQVAQLMENGFEVHLVRALPVRPLDPSLVVDDKASSAWLEERLKGIERRGTQ